MAENIPTSPGGGSVPPRPAEAAKVQPKKETVRINLPPKPTSAPTIKLPTLAPGAPPPASGAPAVAVAVASAPPASRAPAPPSPPAASGLTGLDKGLAIGAAVASVAALGVVVYLVWVLKDTAPM